MAELPSRPEDDGFDGEFAREADLLRSLADDPVERIDAPDDLWRRIADEVHPVGAAGLRNDPTEATSDASAAVPLAPRRPSRRRPLIVGVAAALVAIAVAVGIAVVNRSDIGPREVASARLTAYDGAPVGRAGGRVDVVQDGGRRRLHVDMHDLPTLAPGSYYEMWLLDPAGGAPVSVASMHEPRSDVATYVDLPAGTDTSRFDVVDVSVQQEGAGPAHSGNSVLRGTLTA